MNEIPGQLELPDMPEKTPDAPPGWRWRYEATPGGMKRLVLYPDPPEREKKASEDKS